MFDLGLPELLAVLVVVILIFGPSRVTEIMGALGKGIGEFRASSRGTSTKKEEVNPKPVDETKGA